MELKKIDKYLDSATFQDKQTKPSFVAAVAAAEGFNEAEPAVEDNDGIVEKISDELNTPTSPLSFSRLQPVLTCPPPPQKPKAAPLRKRKGYPNTELRLLDLSNDVLALYPAALLADFGKKMKKAKGGYNDQHLKENIITNINCHNS